MVMSPDCCGVMKVLNEEAFATNLYYAELPHL